MVDRNFSPLAPERVWVADFSGVCDVVGLVPQRLRDRRLRPPDPGLVGGHHDDQQLVLDEV
jgi:hypothetical protein